MIFKSYDQNFNKEFFKLVESSDKISISAHKPVDDDAVSSLLFLFTVLKTKFPEKDIQIIQTGEKNLRFKIFKNFEKINFVSDIETEINYFDLAIFLDGSQFHRFSDNPEGLKSFRGKTVCIDHHNSPIDSFDLTLSMPEIPSCVEILYQTFSENIELDVPTAEIIMLGILSDTGNFRFLKPHQLGTLEIAKEVLEVGSIEIQEFLSRFSSISLNAFEIVKELAKNSRFLEVEGWPRFHATFITREFVRTGNYKDVEIYEASHIYTGNYLTAIKDANWGIALTPRSGGEISASLRSLPKSVNVRVMMEEMGLGGGHDRAAGAKFYSSEKERDTEECLKEITEWMKKNKPVIT